MPGEITRILASLQGGDPGAFSAVFPLIYDELRRMARNRMRAERPGHTLSPTALVHEETGWRVVDRAMDVAGGFGIFRKAGLERLFRDVRLGRIHPANSFLTHEFVAKTAPGIDFDESLAGGRLPNSVLKAPRPAIRVSERCDSDVREEEQHAEKGGRAASGDRHPGLQGASSRRTGRHGRLRAFSECRGGCTVGPRPGSTR